MFRLNKWCVLCENEVKSGLKKHIASHYKSKDDISESDDLLKKLESLGTYENLVLERKRLGIHLRTTAWQKPSDSKPEFPMRRSRTNSMETPKTSPFSSKRSSKCSTRSNSPSTRYVFTNVQYSS